MSTKDDLRDISATEAPLWIAVYAAEYTTTRSGLAARVQHTQGYDIDGMLVAARQSAEAARHAEDMADSAVLKFREKRRSESGVSNG